MFLHPFFSQSPVRAAMWEAQAVGRAQRPGQQRQVYVHRLPFSIGKCLMRLFFLFWVGTWSLLFRVVTTRTLEQELHARRGHASYELYFKTMRARGSKGAEMRAREGLKAMQGGVGAGVGPKL